MARGKTETRRSTAIAEAQSLGIDTDGMSTRQVNAAIGETKEAQNEMANFITKVLDSRPAPVAQPPAQDVTRTTKTEDAPSSLFPKGGGGKGGGGGGVPVPFYCWIEGKVGRIIVQCQSAPSPID